jgi:hypothetical protein
MFISQCSKEQKKKKALFLCVEEEKKKAIKHDIMYNLFLIFSSQYMFVGTSAHTHALNYIGEAQESIYNTKMSDRTNTKLATLYMRILKILKQ